MGRLVAQLQRVFADQFAALEVATACQGLEMEAPPGQRQDGYPRGIQKQRCILRHPTSGDNPAHAEVALVDAYHVGENRVAGCVGSAIGAEGVYLSLLKTAHYNQVNVAAAIFPDLSQHIVNLGLVKVGAAGKAAVAGVKNIGRQMLNNAFHRPPDRAAAFGIAGRLTAVNHTVLQVTKQLAQPFLFLIIHLVRQAQVAGSHIRAAYFHRSGEYLCVVAAPHLLRYLSARSN